MKKLNTLLTAVLISSLLSCGQKNSGTNSESLPITKPVENIDATPDQKERRAKSEDYCKVRNIPIYKNPNSLFVDSEESVTTRVKDEVVDRALALWFIGLKSEGLEQKHLDKMDEDFNIHAKLTPSEAKYAESTDPSEQQIIDANWRYESLHVLLWSLGFIDSLRYPGEMCNVADDVKVIYELGETKFREKSKLRTKKEILDQADLILRLHWACVNARVKNEEAPGGLNASVVYERHYALNWLIRYLDQEWDDVSTDT